MGKERAALDAEPLATRDDAPTAVVAAPTAAPAALFDPLGSEPSPQTVFTLAGAGGNAAVVRYLESQRQPPPGGSGLLTVPAEVTGNGGPGPADTPPARAVVATDQVAPGNPDRVAGVTSQEPAPAMAANAGPVAAVAAPAPPPPAPAGGSVGSPSPAVAGAGAGGAPAAPAVDLSNPAALLSSIAAAPASQFPAAVAAGRAGSAAALQRQRTAVSTAMPKIAAPTGLAPAANPRPAGAAVPAGRQVEPPASGTRQGPEPDVRHTEPAVPVPGSQTPAVPREPAAEEDQGGWWSWLASGISRFLGSLSSTDPGVDTSAGPRPSVDLTGDADPVQGARSQAAGQESVSGGRGEADSATGEPRGETGIAPTPRSPRILQTRLSGTASAGAAGGGPASMPLVPPDLLSALDAGGTQLLAGEAAQQTEAYAIRHAEFTDATAEAYREGECQIADESAATAREQHGLTDQARADVGAERVRWQQENRQIEERFGVQSDARRREVEGQIQAKVETTHVEAAGKLADAEGRADAEKRTAEAEAARRKQEAENKPRSFWESVKGAISSAFDAIRSVVRGIFDKLRSVVRTIIEAAKSAVHTLIEAARDVVKGLIRGYGAFVKGLVSVALAAFPDAAARARAWIDSRVDEATAAVDRAAETLERATDAILDGVGRAVDAALSLVEGALVLALDGMEFLAKGPFELMELLEKFGRWLVENNQFIEGARKLMDDPGSVLEAMRAELGAMIAAVPAKAMEALTALESQLPEPARRHVQGVQRYLGKGLDHLRDHWWDELKTLGKTMLWPWPTVGKHVSGIWTSIKDLWAAAGQLQVSRAIDDWLKIQQDLNAILGAVYGWFFIASVLIGTVVGAFFGGAGAIPGALAGAAFAGEVGEALVVVLIATEAAVITKSVVDLSRGENTRAEDETDYEHIAGSTLTITVTGAMVLLGELAGQLAKSIWNGVKGLFKGGPSDAAAEAAAGAAHPDTAGGEAESATQSSDTATGENASEGCFVAGTPVLTPAGPRAIETLSPGDKVYAVDPGSGLHTIEPVAALHSRQAPGTVLLSVAATSIECSPEHPFWVNGSGWTPAGSLQPGDALLSHAGTALPLTATSRETGPRTVYNLTVGGVHTFFVSPAAILVHNKAKRAIHDPPELAELRGNTETHLNDLEARAKAAMGRAEAMPADAPGRAEMIDEAAQLKERFAELHDGVAEASDAEGIRAHETGTDAASAELEKLEGRVKPREGEAPSAAARLLKFAEVRAAARKAIGALREFLKSDAVRALDKRTRATLDGEMRTLDADLASVDGDVAAVEADPELADLGTDEFEQLRKRAEELQDRATKATEVPETSDVPRPGLKYPKNMLPTEGDVPYISPDPSGEPVQAPEGGGYLDNEGRVWQVDRTKARTGRFFEWDVQTADGGHINVGSDGTITH